MVLMQPDLPEFLVFLPAPEIRYCSAPISLAPVSIWYDSQNDRAQIYGYEETKKAMGFCSVKMHREDI